MFVDHGLMRKNEAEQVVTAFRDHFHVPLVHVDADRAVPRPAGRASSIRRRSGAIIGEEFIRVFEEEAARARGRPKFLVQGTLYSDVIESGGSGGNGAAKIKSHHNVGGLPERFDFDLIEPLRQLFKDEVRAVGAELGLPERFVWRQPFPGPGLAIRVVGGEVTRERLDILREADAILQDEIRRAGLYRELWQSFCVLPAVRSVGVQGDERTYAYPIVIRAVTSDDAMTADWARLPYDLLETVSSRIINEIPHVNRVALDISSKPPSTIEWEWPRRCNPAASRCISGVNHNLSRRERKGKAMDMVRRLEPLALLLLILVALNWAIDAVFGTNIVNEVLSSNTAEDVLYIAGGVSALILLPKLMDGLHLMGDKTRPHGA